MACVTATEVKAIMDGCTLTDTQVEPYILTAHKFVDAVFADDTITTADTKKEIEKWLTAHLIASIHYRTTVTERIGEAEVRYAAKYGEGLNSTPYGQMVLQLDTTGKMALAGKKGATIYAVESFDETTAI